MEHLKNEIDYWQLASKLEEGRNVVLRMVARHEKLESILNTLCEKAQIYNPLMQCSILRLNNNTKTLHPIASVSLPDFYCQALDGVTVGSGVGSCGTAAFTRKRVIVEDINTHPYWNQYKELALSAGLQSCWSEPIIGEKGVVLGTFAIYYHEPKAPTKEDLRFIELSANLAAVVFENSLNREKLLSANNLLSKTVNERNTELEHVNLALGKAIEDQNKEHNSMLNIEKMLTTNSLISGFSHEISTPIGTALTAISAAEDELSVLSTKFSEGNLSRKLFSDKINHLTEAIVLNKNSLLRANKLLQRFNDINTFASTEEKSICSMKDFLKEVEQSVQGVLSVHRLFIQSENFQVYCHKESLWQILFNLIENSILHGFENVPVGSIHINVTSDDEEVIINYQDDGCGISEEQTSKIFEPFYTSARNSKNLGLGLSIMNNLVTNNLNGRVRLIDSPIGIRYEIIMPNIQLT